MSERNAFMKYSETNTDMQSSIMTMNKCKMFGYVAKLNLGMGETIDESHKPARRHCP